MFLQCSNISLGSFYFWTNYHARTEIHQLNTVTTHTHTHPFNGPFSGTTWVNRYQKGKTNLDFTEARDSEWQWHHLDHMQVCTSLQTDNHASTPPLSFFTGRMPFLSPNNSVKALWEIPKKAPASTHYIWKMAEVLTKQFTTRKQFRVGSHTARTLRMTKSWFSCSLHALTVKHNQQCRSTKEERINNYDAVLSNVRTCVSMLWQANIESGTHFWSTTAILATWPSKY